MIAMEVTCVIVNLEAGVKVIFVEEDLADKEPEEALDMVGELYPDWTSLVITVVRKA